MRRIPSVQLLVVSEQLPVWLLAVDVLVDRTAQCHGEHLYAPADAQYRNLSVVSQADKQQFGQITFVIDAVQLRNRFFASKQRVQVASARKQKAVYMLQHIGQRIPVLKRRDDDRSGSRFQYGFKITFGQFAPLFSEIACNTDYRLFFISREAVVVLAVSGFPVEVTGTHEGYFLFKTIGISLLMLCSSEIKVSVEITPGISCSLLFNSSIRWALSQAYSLMSIV